MEEKSAQEKLLMQMALKRQHDEELASFKASNDVGVLRAWAQMGYKQPAPQVIQELKSKLGLSWRGMKKFIESM